MTMKTTFEDRLLAELQGEIERREAAPVPAAGRRVVTGRRLAVAAGACAVAGLAVVVPGSPADSPAYAVEKHGDGSVTLTLNDLTLDRGAQRELAERLDADGIDTDIQNFDGTQKCRLPRGEAIKESSSGSNDTPVPEEPGGKSSSPQKPRAGKWTIMLHRGDTLAFENYDLKKSVTAMSFYAVKGAIEPCEAVKTSPVVEEAVKP
nr:hypothetical protein OG999_24170 [Streptomyces sp. NBC_00886]